ncbi:hypothetical protein [Halomonas urumqiensis]|uniref:hypothetical protein n=1 Tax=Halomonas urumqiensis TaxID=1684789 RepID=UPI0011AF3251|nr:hypothetical protein [Halomonas urumqiensis]
MSGTHALTPEDSPENIDASAGAEIGAAAEQRTTDNHRYTLGREHSETPTLSSGTRPERRDTTPPRLHIGEVVIRVEEAPKPKGAKRDGSRSTPSDSQRLVRSL